MPLIDHRARDVAVLVRPDPHDEPRRTRSHVRPVAL
jgi:hypothetical protein